MKKTQLILGLVLFGLGLIGIASLLTVDMPIPPETEEILLQQFSPFQIKMLLLVNPSILLLIAVLIGSLLYTKVGLEVPLLKSLIERKPFQHVPERVKFGLFGGLVAGVLLSAGSWLFQPFIPTEFTALSENLQLNLVVKLLYGGITEELLLRFGLMTLIVWVVYKLSKKLNRVVYWTGILLSALVFAIGHFPVAYQAVASPSAVLLTYILLGNSVGGIAFGWLYWRKGLESAILAHMVAHLVMTGFASLA